MIPTRFEMQVRNRTLSTLATHHFDIARFRARFRLATPMGMMSIFPEGRSSVKKLLIASTILPFLAAGPAFAQAANPDDMLTPMERSLNRQPDVNPDWTWMTENRVTRILKGGGYDVILSLERSGAFWRGKAIRNNESYHVAINRYCEVFGHLDHKSLALRALMAAESKVAKPPQTMVATLNGAVPAYTSQLAPTALTPAPVRTVMGEVGWTWMTEGQVIRILKSKGYTDISSATRDVQGIWRANAIKDGLASRVALDVYGNVEAELSGGGAVAQVSPNGG